MHDIKQKIKSTNGAIYSEVARMTPSVTLEREWATLLYSGFVGGGGPDCPHLQLRRGMGQGFHRTIGFPSSLFKKFWALRDGILIVRKEGIAKLLVDVDAMEVVSIACSCHVPNFFFFFLIIKKKVFLTFF